MKIRTCHHVLANGVLCQGFALRHRNYCRFHMRDIGCRMRAARSRARGAPPPLQLPLLEDPWSAQIALMQVADALTAGHIDPACARALTTIVRLAMQNVKYAESCQNWQTTPLPKEPATDVSTEWPTFEQEYDLPEGLDLSLEPEIAFPPLQPEPQPEPPLVTMARKVIGDAATRDGPEVTATDIEVWEAAEREGELAGMARREKLERNQRRRERRLELNHYEELARRRNLQMRAQTMVWEQEREQKARMVESAAVLGTIGPGAPAAITLETQRKPPQSQASRPNARAAGT